MVEAIAPIVAATAATSEPPGREGQPSVLLTSVQPNQFPRSMIQGGSEVVDGITDDEGPVGWKRLVEAHLDNHGIRLRVFVKAEVLAVSCKGIAGSPQIRDVLIGPFDF